MLSLDESAKFDSRGQKRRISISPWSKSNVEVQCES